MAQNIFRLVLTDEAQDFIESLPEAVSYKIYYNIKRIAGGERNKELFKKLENSEIWEFRTLIRLLIGFLPFGIGTKRHW